jgi:hypothetical protein
MWQSVIIWFERAWLEPSVVIPGRSGLQDRVKPQELIGLAPRYLNPDYAATVKAPPDPSRLSFLTIDN